MTTSVFLAALLRSRRVRLASGQPLGPDGPLPRTLDAFALRFALAPPA
ncbi:hypothetical protein ACFQHO_03250 [Actinomadura yumaensis]